MRMISVISLAEISGAALSVGLCGRFKSGALVHHDILQDILQRPAWSETYKRRYTVDVRDAPLHVLEPCRISLRVWDKVNFRLGLRLLDHQFGKFTHGDFLIGADIEDPAERSGPGQQLDEGWNDVLNMAKAAGLGSVAMDREGHTAERLGDEIRHDHSVLACLARSDRVEQASDDNGQPRLLVVGHGQKFIGRLRIGVSPAGLVGRLP